MLYYPVAMSLYPKNYSAQAEVFLILSVYRPGLRFQYSTQTTLQNRGPLDFLLRVSAGSDTELLSGSTEEVSDSDENGDNRPSTDSRSAAEPVPGPNPSQLAPVVVPLPQESNATGRLSRHLF